MGSARQTGGDGRIRCVTAPVLVRGKVQVDRHSIAFLVQYCPRHGEKPFQMPKPTTMHQSIARIPGLETCYTSTDWCGDE